MPTANLCWWGAALMPGGGYKLAKDYAEISVAEIINAVDEQIDATQCGGHENCRDEGRCMTHDLWATLNSKILDYLAGISLADMVASQNNVQAVTIKPRTCPVTEDATA